MIKNFLILLDLDNTLITSSSQRIYHPHIDNGPNGLKPQYIFLRPHLDEFLSFLFTHFEVGLWSAATCEWINTIILSTPSMEKYKNKFLFIWDNTQCSSNKAKPLQKVWKKYPQYQQHNTIIIDDILTTETPNIQNRLNIGKYKVHQDMYQDNELLKIICILEYIIKTMSQLKVKKIIDLYKKALSFV